MYCSINHKIIAEDKAVISINERGFLFGDGIFETCRVINFQIYNFDAHLRRLIHGLQAIKINYNVKDLEEHCLELIEKNNLKEGLIRIYISRGIGSDGYMPKDQIKPLIIVQNKLIPQKPIDKIDLFISKIRKISKNSLPTNYKISQGLNSTLAKIEAQENNCFDSILLNEKDEICETASANIFWIKNDILYTPHLDCGLLEGTIRQKIIDLSPIKVEEVFAKIADLLNCDELFISNVSYLILPIKKILPDHKKFQQKKYFNIFKEILNKDLENLKN